MKLMLKNSELFALIDDEDAQLASLVEWRYADVGSGGCGYVMAARRINGVYQLLHRYLLAAPKGVIVDHKNGDGLDNRRANLRLCSHAQNMQNSKTRKHNKSGIRNVYFERNRGHGYWRALVRMDGKKHTKAFPGTEVGKQMASEWAAQKRLELHGDFAIDFRGG